jgi:hypothetical protein
LPHRKHVAAALIECPARDLNGVIERAPLPDEHAATSLLKFDVVSEIFRGVRYASAEARARVVAYSMGYGLTKPIRRRAHRTIMENNGKPSPLLSVYRLDNQKLLFKSYYSKAIVARLRLKNDLHGSSGGRRGRQCVRAFSRRHWACRDDGNVGRTAGYRPPARQWRAGRPRSEGRNLQRRL